MILCGACLPAERTVADELSAPSPASPPPLQVSIVNESPTSQAILHAYVTAGTNKLNFLLPTGFRMDANTSTPDMISLVNGDCNCWLTFCIAVPLPSNTKGLESGRCRALLLNRHSDVKILEEFSVVAAGQHGPAFDLQWENSSGLVQRARSAFIPSAAGVLEFELLTNPDNFPKFQNTFDAFLLNFRTGVDDNIESAPQRSGV